jgi:hypothetical protein
MPPVMGRAAVSSFLCLVAACTSSSTSITSPTATRCPVDVSLSPATIGASGGSGQITIGVNPECTWEARSETDWITLANASGQGQATVAYTASPNPLVSDRRGMVAVNDQRVEVVQAAAACTFALAGSGDSVGAEGGTLRLTVTAQPSCVWTAISQASWIHVAGGRDGNGQGVVEIRAETNEGDARRGTILVAGQSYVVSQAAQPRSAPTPTPAPAPRPGCTFNVSPTSQSIDADGGQREVRVESTGSNCTWTAVPGAPWINVTSGTGNGDGRARYAVARNIGPARTGALVVAGTTVTVMQEAAPPETVSLEGEVAGLTGQCPNFVFRLQGRTVRTNSETSIEGGCDRIRERREVRVTGIVQPDGSVLALRVRREDD